MRFTYAQSMTDPAHYVPLARAAEAARFTSDVETVIANMR